MTDPRSPIPDPRYACLYDVGATQPSPLCSIAQEFSPRYERRGGDAVIVDVSGLERLFGDARTIAGELQREAVDRGLRVNVAIAPTPVAAQLLARARPGVSVITERGAIASALAPLPLGLLAGGLSHPEPESHSRMARGAPPPRACHAANTSLSLERRLSASGGVSDALSAFQTWGLKTLGDLAALPSDALAARLGRAGLACQALARGDDGRPLVPDVADERFESSLDLEWPIDALEPLSFVLTRLLEPLSIRLERRDRGVAVLHVQLTLVTGELYARRVDLPSPIRDVRALRTLALLDLEAHPPPAGVDRVAVVIDPTPGRVLQHTLFVRPLPTPERLSTLLARLGAVMGQDRVGAPAAVDSYRPGAFAMQPFATEWGTGNRPEAESHSLMTRGAPRAVRNADQPASNHPDVRVYPERSVVDRVASTLRRCRHPVPARVGVDGEARPVRVTTDRRGFAGGTVLQAAGPWKTSGDWWTTDDRRLTTDDRVEWDVALSDGAIYRIFQDRATKGWFIDAIVD